jgi:site-specific recombinase XerD
MSDLVEVPRKSPRIAWNKGKLIGPKPPLKPKHVWSIRTRLQLEGRTRDLAMFNLAIDSKLRGCDVVALKVEDVAPHGSVPGAAVAGLTVRIRPHDRGRLIFCKSRLQQFVDRQVLLFKEVRHQQPEARIAAIFDHHRNVDRSITKRFAQLLKRLSVLNAYIVCKAFEHPLRHAMVCKATSMFRFNDMSEFVSA